MCASQLHFSIQADTANTDEKNKREKMKVEKRIKKEAGKIETP